MTPMKKVMTSMKKVMVASLLKITDSSEMDTLDRWISLHWQEVGSPWCCSVTSINKLWGEVCRALCTSYHDVVLLPLNLWLGHGRAARAMEGQHVPWSCRDHKAASWCYETLPYPPYCLFGHNIPQYFVYIPYKMNETGGVS